VEDGEKKSILRERNISVSKGVQRGPTRSVWGEKPSRHKKKKRKKREKRRGRKTICTGQGAVKRNSRVGGNTTVIREEGTKGKSNPSTTLVRGG